MKLKYICFLKQTFCFLLSMLVCIMKRSKRENMELGDFQNSFMVGVQQAEILSWNIASCCNNQPFLKLFLHSEINYFESNSLRFLWSAECFLEVEARWRWERRMRLRECNCMCGNHLFPLDFIRFGTLVFVNWVILSFLYLTFAFIQKHFQSD